MFEMLSGVVAAFGLILVGYKYFNSLIRGMAGREVRLVVSRWTPNGVMAGLWGVLVGLIMQDMKLMVGMVSSLMATGVFSRRKAVIIMIGSELGAALFYYVIFARPDAIVLYLLGLTGLFWFLERPCPWRCPMGCLFFLFMMIYGVFQLEGQSSLLATLPSVAAMGETVRHVAPGLLFVASCLVALSYGVALPWLLLTMAFYHANLITLEQVMMVIYGITFGTGLASVFLARKLEGFGRKSFVMRGALKASVAILFVVSFLVERAMGSHALRDFVFSGGRFELEMVNLLVIVNVVVAFLSLILLHPICSALEPDAVEEGAAPSLRFVNPVYPYDLDSAGDLVHKELVELASKLPSYLEQRLENPQEADVAQLSRHTYFSDIVRQLDSFNYQQMSSQVSVEATSRFFLVVDELHRLCLLEETLHKLSQIVLPSDCSSHAKTLFVQMLESQHALVSTLADTLQSGSGDDWDLLHQVTSHEGSFFEEIRRTYFATDTECSQEEKALVFDLTNFIQLAAWLIHQWQPLGLKSLEK